MNIRDRYDELDNMIETIDSLLYDITSKDLKEDLQELQYRYWNEREELEQKIYEEEEKEEMQANYEFEKSRI